MKIDKKENSPIQNYFRFARSIYGEDLLENFLVSAVASVLGIRLLLYLTGYPALTGGGLHIAHMLWGGLLMLIAFFISLGFLSHPAHEWAAVIGGVGFGAFIDEVGKYVTNDNNYFFQPTIAIIYVTFILIYLAIRTIYGRRPFTPREQLANAFEIMQQASLNGLERHDERTINDFLKPGDAGDPLTMRLKEMLPWIKVITSRRRHWLDQLKDTIDTGYQKIVSRWWFAGVVMAFFAFTAVTGFSSVIGVISSPWIIALGFGAAGIVLLSLLQVWNRRIPNLQVPLSGGVIALAIVASWIILLNRGIMTLPFADWALFICSNISSILIIAGIIFMARSRLLAYRMFHRAILVSILLTAVFAFYAYQFYALIGVFLNLLLLIALRYMIQQEETKIGLEPANRLPVPPPAPG